MYHTEHQEIIYINALRQKMARLYYHPVPYPDELIGSMLLRLGHHLGLSIKETHKLLGLSAVSHWPLLFKYQIKLIAAAFSISEQELLFCHTPFPYITAFMSMEQTVQLANSFSEIKARHSVTPSQSATTGGVLIRYCEECIQDDIKTFGEDYWHRRHNLPFVVRCWKHGCLLKHIERNDAGATILTLPHDQQGKTVDPVFDLNIHSLVDPLSISLLDSKFRQPTEKWQSFYRKIALERGFPIQGNLLSSKAISRGFLEYFGEDRLCKAGLGFTPQRAPWPTTILRLSPVSCITAKHILIRIYLQNAEVPESVTNRPPGTPPINCAKMDLIFSSKIKILLSKIKKGSRVTVTKILTTLGIHSIVKHHRKELPLTSETIHKFLQTDLSERQTGRRKRKRKSDINKLE